MLLEIIIFLSLGFVGLFYGAKFVVVSLENIAQRYNVSHLMVGLTILAIGTSLPEIAISVIGGLDKVTGIDPQIDGIIIGNKVGSFFTQITLILGILGVSQRIFISKWKLRREGLMLFLSVLIFTILSLDGTLNGSDGWILICSYSIYLGFIIWSEKKLEKKQAEIKEFIAKRDGLELESEEKAKESNEPNPKLGRNIIIFIIGLSILLFSAELTIISAHKISIVFNIPENVVGVLIVGFGTSLPELIADMMALKRESGGIAVGDILGSNVCDILLASGSGSVIANFNIPPIILMFDIPILFAAIGLIIYFLNTDNTLKCWESVVIIGFYGFYAFLKIFFFKM